MFPAVCPAPELLAPAGSPAMMRAAFGADAVHAARLRYSLRVRNNEFGSFERLERSITEAHGLGRKLYLVGNVLPHNAKVRTCADMAPVVALVSRRVDHGRRGPHRSGARTLAGRAGASFRAGQHHELRGRALLGKTRHRARHLVARTVAGRNRRNPQGCPGIELEVFVHGALCVAYSGRCLLSGYFNRRDFNQGAYTNACRWNYCVKPAREDAAGDVWLVEERERPGALMPVEEDEHGTYLMNSKDLRALEHVERLVGIGVDALKIEGRTRSAYYAARTVQVYRRAIDGAAAGRPFDPRLFGEIEGLANRGYTDRFYQRHHASEMQNYLRGCSESGHSRYVGDVVGWDASRGLAEVEVKNRFAVGDRIEIIHPSGNLELQIGRMENANGASIAVAPGNGHRVWIRLPRELPGAFLARFV